MLLRGINLGSRNRVAMPELREALGQAGLKQVRTYVQSGNVVLESRLGPDRLAHKLEQLIAKRFGLQIDVIVRTRDELAEVVARNPLKDVATEPKRYQVSFLSAELAPDSASRLHELATGDERVAVTGREVYAWHPAGVARSKLWNQLAGNGLGVTATSRNWTTVQTLLAMASEL